MGRKGKKQYIDKKNAITFKLTPSAPGEQSDDDGETSNQFKPYGPPPTDIRLKEAREAGIKFANMQEYDYAQHLRKVDGAKLQLTPLDMRAVEVQRKEESSSASKMGGGTSAAPNSEIDMSELFAAQVTLPVGDEDIDELDDDVLAALESDYEYDEDDGLEDDFMSKANEGDMPAPRALRHPFTTVRQPVIDEESDSDDDEGEEEEHKAGDLCLECGSGECFGRCVEGETSTVVTKRREHVTEQRRKQDELGEAQLRKVLEGYTDDALADVAMADDDEMGGYLEPDDERMAELVDAYVDKRTQMRANTDIAFATAPRPVAVFKKPMPVDRSVIPSAPNNTLQSSPSSSSESEEEGDEVIDLVDEEAAKEKWDCESILTTASTLYNHPTLISEPINTSARPSKRKLRAMQIELDRQGVPVQATRARGLTARKLRKLGLGEGDMESVQSMDTATSTVSSFRPKNETPEERRARKAIVRAERKERRQDKKANKVAFKEESTRQTQQKITNIQTNKSIMSL